MKLVKNQMHSKKYGTLYVRHNEKEYVGENYNIGSRYNKSQEIELEIGELK